MPVPDGGRPPRGPALEHPRAHPGAPVDATQVPRFAGEATFARLPSLDQVGRAAVAVAGVPFDSGVATAPERASGRTASAPVASCCAPTTRRSMSRRSRHQVADAGDLSVNPFDIREAVGQVEAAATEVLTAGRHPRRPRRRPHDLAAAAPRDRCPARTGRARALRRPPRHVGHLLRRPGRTARRSAGRSRRGCSTLGHSAHVGIRGPLYADRRPRPGPRPRLRHREHHRHRPPRRRRGHRPGASTGWAPDRSTSRSTSTCSTPRTRRARAPPRPAG